MGAYSPSRLISEELDKKILKKIIEPTLKGLKDLNCTYKGFLYAGLMIIDKEPYLIEYNVRMGDPECQTILPRLKSDFFEIINSCCNKTLKNTNIEWHNNKSLCIVLCSKGYPDKFEKNIVIENIDKINLKNNEYLFHAGTFKDKEKIYSNGGRVLNFVTLSENFKTSRQNSIKLIEKLNWSNGHYRRDIGYKVIN
tara:strand:- start:146 stop:733 length:588 start_codon:yes stop_codon:yes gene_type:complete